jgi:diacylglycerol kinase (ATP)
MSRTVRVVLIVENPRAGAAGAAVLVDQLADQLDAGGFDVVRESNPQRVRERLTRVPLDSSPPYACVVCAGGDGTVAMVANWADAETPLAVLPLGTENLLARQFGFDRDVDGLVRRIVSGSTFLADAGEANGQLFLVVASVGFDAEVVRLLAARRTGHIRHSTWIRPLLHALGSYQFPEIRVTTASGSRPIRTRWAFVFNLPRYALGLRFVEESSCHDGKLDLCCFRGGRWWNGLKYLAGVAAGWHRSWRDTHVEQVTWLRIEADQPVPYQLDGDPGGELPLEVRVLPQRLRLLGDGP